MWKLLWEYKINSGSSPSTVSNCSPNSNYMALVPGSQLVVKTTYVVKTTPRSKPPMFHHHSGVSWTQFWLWDTFTSEVMWACKFKVKLFGWGSVREAYVVREADIEELYDADDRQLGCVYVLPVRCTLVWTACNLQRMKHVKKTYNSSLNFYIVNMITCTYKLNNVR